mgnify:CR=1 FL=1
MHRVTALMVHRTGATAEGGLAGQPVVTHADLEHRLGTDYVLLYQVVHRLLPVLQLYFLELKHKRVLVL